MIQMPYDTIVEKITTASNLSSDEVNKKIDEKMNVLSGLISKEGAAHIIANELGVKLFDFSKKVKVKDLLPGMRDIKIVGKVTQIYEIHEFSSGERSGKVGAFLLGDETGQIRIVLWNDQAELLHKLAPDIVVRLENVWVKDNQNRSEIHFNDKSKLVMSPEDETVGEVGAIKQPSSTVKKIKDITDKDSYVSLMGTVVQVFEPRFFEVCPTCSKRARAKDDGFSCEVHGMVTPDYSYVMNFFLDDGSDNIRIVCFGNVVEALTKKTKEDLLALREAGTGVDELKHDLLGLLVKCRGRVTKNQMFDRLECIANNIERDLNPEKELATIQTQENQEKEA